MDALAVIILIGAVALVAFTVVFNIVRKRKGKSSCGCSGCNGCPSAGTCGAKKPAKDDKKSSEKT